MRLVGNYSQMQNANTFEKDSSWSPPPEDLPLGNERIDRGIPFYCLALSVLSAQVPKGLRSTFQGYNKPKIPCPVQPQMEE